MQIKLKKCDGPCNADKPIWKNLMVDGTRRRFCRSCYSLEKKRELQGVAKPTKRNVPSRSQKPKPIPKQSPKRKKEDILYSTMRKVFLEQHPVCMIGIQGVCSNQRSNQIHHTYSGKDRAKYYLDTSTWLATEQKCHDWVHAHSHTARELGFLK